MPGPLEPAFGVEIVVVVAKDMGLPSHDSCDACACAWCDWCSTLPALPEEPKAFDHAAV